MSLVRSARPGALALILVLVAACGAGTAQPSGSVEPATGMPESPGASSPVSPAPSLPASASPAAPGASTSASPAASGSAAPGGSAGAGQPDVVVTGVEYAFEGMPDSVPVGTTLGFRDAGSEVHEMVVFRLNDDVTTSWEELLAMPGDEAQKFVTEKGAVFAAPGQDADGTITLDQPGRYVMLCFVPVGTTEVPSANPSEAPGASAPAGPPHFTQGMVKPFTVTG